MVMGCVLFEIQAGFLNIILVCLCLQVNAEMVPKFQVATACFSCSPPDFKLIKITPCCGCRRFNFLNYRQNNQKFKISLSV
jgi:hypothetical protein